MPLSEDDFMESCTYAGGGVIVYTAPPDLDNTHVCSAKRGSRGNVAVEPPGDWGP